MIHEAIKMIVGGMNLSEAEMSSCMTEIMEGRASDLHIAAFLTALRMKGETVDEITGAARIMRQKSSRINAPEGTLDTCGTGGDMSGTFNISTTSAIVVAACGVPVAKHGNRSVSSHCGSADVLEALGVKIDLTPDKVERSLSETGFGFLFAPLFHPAMKYAIGARKELGFRTIFNILGPITNPAGAKRQIVGVFGSDLTETLCQVLGNLGAEDAMVVHGEDGLDEITITDSTRVSRLVGGKVETSFISPDDFGIKTAAIAEIAGQNRERNAEITHSVLAGDKGPCRDIVLMNSAAALLVAGRSSYLRDAAAIAADAIDSGRAKAKLQEIVKFTNGA